MALNLSSVRTMVLHSGRSRERWMASNSHLVVQMPQPMHLFGSTTDAPQPRQRAVSVFTCSSVRVPWVSRKERPGAGAAASWRAALS